MNWPLRCAKLEIMVSLFLGCFEGWQEWLESIIYLEQLPPLERLVMFLNHQSLIWEPHVCFKNWAFIPGRLWFIFPVISLQFPYQQYRRDLKEQMPKKKKKKMQEFSVLEWSSLLMIYFQEVRISLYKFDWYVISISLLSEWVGTSHSVMSDSLWPHGL